MKKRGERFGQRASISNHFETFQNFATKLLPICYSKNSKSEVLNSRAKVIAGAAITLGRFMELVRFYALIVKVALVLAMMGQLQSCTLELMGLAAAKSRTGLMSYSAFNKRLWNGK